MNVKKINKKIKRKTSKSITFAPRDIAIFNFNIIPILTNTPWSGVRVWTSTIVHGFEDILFGKIFVPNRLPNGFMNIVRIWFMKSCPRHTGSATDGRSNFTGIILCITFHAVLCKERFVLVSITHTIEVWFLMLVFQIN